MKRLTTILLLAFLAVQPQNSNSKEIESTKISPALIKSMNTASTASSDSLVEVVVLLENPIVNTDIDKSGVRKILTRGERIKSVSSQLKKFRPTGYDQIENFLSVNSSESPKSYWIVPAFSAKIPVSKIEELEQFESVQLIVENVNLSFDEPVEMSPAPALSTSVSPHVAMLNVSELWNRGITGKGRLVCSFDTGVEVGHPALAGKWRGHTSSLSSSWYSVVEPDSLPNDNVGHGTHTMGIMVGSSGPDTIGVAFDAQWITAGVIDQGRPLNATLADILSAFEWVLNPDGDTSTTNDVPDVILNSWGVPKGLFYPCDATFWTVIDNVEAAGIVTVFAAGNEGPTPKSIRSPADRATTPTNSFSVGAIDQNKVIGSFSSRGPSSCDTSQIKPEVVAPGVGVRSSIKNGQYGYMTGTSMAAPFIAGLVALIREFNPDATVDQIKNAIMLSCEDLGPEGEDNAYGHGLPDASKILDFIPPPAGASFDVLNTDLTDNSTPLPGDTFHLRISLAKQSGNVDNIYGTLRSTDNNAADIISDRAGYFFGGSGYTASSVPEYEIHFNSNTVHGQQVGFQLVLEDGTGAIFDTLAFSLTVGLAPKGETQIQNTNRIDFSVSDFAQYGLGPGSIYNTGGAGFRIDGGENLLYEAGIIVGRNQVMMSSSVRDSVGNFKSSEFGPVSSLVQGMDSDGGEYLKATMRDNYSQIVIPITVIQKTKTYGTIPDDGYVIFEYWLYNHTLENLSSLYFGFMTDFDISSTGDYVYFDPATNSTWQQDENGLSIGLVGLTNVSGYSYLTNSAQKTGLTRSQKFNLIGTTNYSTVPQGVSDAMITTRSGPFILAPGDSTKIAFALVIGQSGSEFYDNATLAQQRYNTPTDADDNGNILPSGFVLNQNYPNPFNPTTTISFSLAERQEIDLSIYNLLGQKIKTLFSGPESAGQHSVKWDATDDSGQKVASGVYFYKLIGEAESASMKMTLLK